MIGIFKKLQHLHPEKNSVGIRGFQEQVIAFYAIIVLFQEFTQAIMIDSESSILPSTASKRIPATGTCTNVPVLKPMMIIWQVERIRPKYQAEHERVKQWLKENGML